MDIATTFYQVALNRNPNRRETHFLSELFDSELSADQQRAELEDFVWGLVTCKEFVLKH
jgi:hypothetical protein